MLEHKNITNIPTKTATSLYDEGVPFLKEGMRLEEAQEPATLYNQEYAKALSKFEEAFQVDELFFDALKNLCVMNRHGMGTKPNTTKADWYNNIIICKQELELDPKNIQSLINLAFLFEHGEIIGTNINKAAPYYKQAAEAGSPAAQYKMGTLYQSGDGVEKNVKTAEQYYLQAISSKSKTNEYYAAHINLCVLYYENISEFDLENIANNLKICLNIAAELSESNPNNPNLSQENLLTAILDITAKIEMVLTKEPASENKLIAANQNNLSDKSDEKSSSPRISPSEKLLNEGPKGHEGHAKKDLERY